MLNFKEKIAEAISKTVNINKEELESYIEVPKDTSMGDYAFPCFKLAKELRKAPYCKTISYRTFTFNSNRWSFIQYI